MLKPLREHFLEGYSAELFNSSEEETFDRYVIAHPTDLFMFTITQKSPSHSPESEQAVNAKTLTTLETQPSLIPS